MLYDLQKILEHSVEKNGEITLTNKYLLNIVKMAIRNSQSHYDNMASLYDSGVELNQ